MDEVSTNEPRRATRVALLALGAGLLWAGASLILGLTPAHAADGDRPDGLVGLVTSVTDGASDVVSATTDIVAEVLPPAAPVTPAVSKTVTTVTQGAADVVAVTPDVSPVVTPVVETVVQPVVDEIVQPVVDTAADLTAPIPVVGDVVGAIDLSGTAAALPGVTDAVDEAVDGILVGGSSGPGVILPPAHPGGLLPVHPDGDAPSAVLILPATAPGGVVDAGTPVGLPAATATSASRGLSFAATASPGVATATVHEATDPPTDRPAGGPFSPDSAPPTSGASAASASSFSGAAAELFTPLGSSLLRGTLLPPGDELPGCPVFDTDTSPD
ncbi:hypothetical protein AB0N73_06670 [Microbacterium sp. NPDC089189]|uniref:hypothetical protein n=1 Tax=Microbacterium sp. NPDC089189 TaxID=3154972 RepID=UPI003448BA5C